METEGYVVVCIERSVDNLQSGLFISHPVGARDITQFLRFSGRHFNLQYHLVGPRLVMVMIPTGSFKLGQTM